MAVELMSRSEFDLLVDSLSNDSLPFDTETLVYFYTPTCTSCLSIEGPFKAISENYTGKLRFLKYNLQEAFPSQLASLGFRHVPTFLFFDKQGRRPDLAFFPNEILVSTFKELKTRIDTLLGEVTSAYSLPKKELMNLQVGTKLKFIKDLGDIFKVGDTAEIESMRKTGLLIEFKVGDYGLPYAAIEDCCIII